MKSNLCLARPRLLLAASSLALGLTLSTAALAGQDEIAFDIPAQPLSDAIAEFSRQSRVNVLVPSSVTRGKTSNEVAGEMPADDALRALLDGADLDVALQDDGAFLISQVAPEVAETRTERSFRLAQLVEETDRGRVSEAEEAQDGADHPDRITVTGTLIKGIAPESSPLQMFTREDILESGLGTTELFMRSLPSNFGGGSSEYAVQGLPNNSGTSSNRNYGSSANLRGLGARGTLVLLNGTRLASSSRIGDFVDLSMIPLSALERVEVLSDGASSIYGGDAVAGVINFVLRDDFEGSETSLRYGTVTSGDMDEYRASQTIGGAWSTGNILGTYEFFDRDRLRLSDRPELELFDPRSASISLPDRDDFFLLPSQTRHSAVVAAQQSISPALNVDAMALYSHRANEANYFNQSSSITQSAGSSESLTTALGIEYTISPDWTASLNGSYSQVISRSDNHIIIVPAGGFSFDLEFATRSKLWSVDGKLDGDLFDLPAGAVKLAVGGHYREEAFRDEQVGSPVDSKGTREVYAFFGEAMIPLISGANAGPGFEELSINASGRIEHYSDYGTSGSPKIGLLWSPLQGLKLRGSYSRSFAPPPMGRAFSLSRTATVSPYSNILGRIGQTAPDPSLDGVSWMGLFGDVANLGAETSRAFTAGLDWSAEHGNQTWSVNGTYYNIEFDGRLGTPPIPDGLSTEYTTLIAWEDPDAFPEGTVIFFPSQGQIHEIIDSLQIPATITAGASLDDVGVIDTRGLTRNLAVTKTDGLDVQFNYTVDTGLGTFSAGLNANYILNFTEQATADSPTIRALNTLYKPVDLKLRGHIGMSTEAVSGNLFINHVAAYRSDETAASVPVESWTTLDLTISYRIASRATFIDGTSINVAVNNLLDAMPPATPTNSGFSIVGYDPGNASPLGRYIAFEIRKSF